MNVAEYMDKDFENFELCGCHEKCNCEQGQCYCNPNELDNDMPYHKSIEDKLKDMMSNDNDIINILDSLSNLLDVKSLDKRLEGYRQQADILRFIAQFIESETRSFEMMVK